MYIDDRVFNIFFVFFVMPVVLWEIHLIPDYVCFIYWSFYIFAIILCAIYLICVHTTSAFLRENKNRVNLIDQHHYAHWVWGGFELRNLGVLFRYDIKTDTITCQNLKNNHESFTIEKATSIPLPKTNNDYSIYYEYVFDVFLYSFDNYTDYNDMLLLYKLLAKDPKQPEKQNEYRPVKKKPDIILNINSADVKEITKLPGINVVQAKKAIRYREENGGFKTKVEFYTLLKLKEYFIKEIEDMIEIGETDNKNKFIENEDKDRTVDF